MNEKIPSKQKSFKDLIRIGSEITGSVTGVLIGSLLAGPPGAVAGVIAGVIAGPLFGNAIKKIGDDIANRFLSHNETRRIGIVMIYACNRFEENKKKGLEIRDDGFFNDNIKRSTGEEVIEGILLIAQREYQEKKLQYQGNLLANIAVCPEIDQAQANYLIKLAATLTYRQLCMLTLIEQKKKYSISELANKSAKYRPDEFTSEELSLIQELHLMYTQGIVSTYKGGMWTDTLAI